ncbi:MAG: carboxypeptidase-like regulatory domain-containing protein [Bacteroidetes bacterium]|jgi:hypothetical protein|nr:carboxypeptidase-like regulatory domain-containing protein [Bacteroidota bacterium]MDA0974297.1 carboxypeptidase-like regulatory domain-containing protein [Bacteroidota bacterium]
MRLKLVFFASLLSFFGLSLDAQNVIQFSGIVVTGDSLNPVPYTNIIVDNSKRGTTTDYFGFFSFVAQERDTITFKALGFRESRFIIPDSLHDKRYSLIQVLFPDTIMLNVVNIYPWDSREAFREAFINAPPPEDDFMRAANNLSPSRMLVMMETMDRDGYTNYKLAANEYTNQLYYAGQAPPINLMNPMAWASFIDALRTGKLKQR